MKETVIDIIGYILIGAACGLFMPAMYLTLRGVKKSKPIQPIIQVEYSNGVCDTTYIYKF